MGVTSIYLHIPFCRRRCGYCDFNTFAGLSHLIPDYIKALCSEIRFAAEVNQKNHDIHTIYFGGGTPSLLQPDQVRTVLNCIRGHFHVVDDLEITMEANPGTVSLESMKGYADAGVNRMSFGMQSASPEDLQLLDRQHQYSDVLHAVENTTKAGIKRINLDLIFGIPGQSLERWLWTLQMALNTGVEHLSLYSLIVEEGTPLYRWVMKGMVQAPEDDLAAEMYEAAGELLKSSGYSQYEISNWSLGPEARCRHNLQYWRYEPFWGFGAGATGFIDGIRIDNLVDISEYLEAIKNAGIAIKKKFPAAREITQLSLWDQMQERLMVGLRLTNEGVDFDSFQKQFGVEITSVFSKQIDLLTGEGLIERYEVPGRGIRLTPKGRLLGNQVFMQFVGNPVPKILESRLNQ